MEAFIVVGLIFAIAVNYIYIVFGKNFENRVISGIITVCLLLTLLIIGH